jgi:hypothetical protein
VYNLASFYKKQFLKKNDMQKPVLFLFFVLINLGVNAQQKSTVFFAESEKDQHSAKVVFIGDCILQSNNYFTSAGVNNSVIRKLSVDLMLLETIVLTNENYSIRINDLISLQDGSLIAIGSKELIDNPGFYEIMILKLDENLNIMDEFLYNMNTGALDFTYHFIRENGNIVVASSVNGNPPNFMLSYFDYLIFEMDTNMQMVFDSIYNYSPSEVVMDFTPIPGTENALLLCSPNFEPGNESKRINVLNENYELIEAFYIPEWPYHLSIEVLSNQNSLINSWTDVQNGQPSAWQAQQRLVDAEFVEIDVNVFGSPDTMMSPAQYNSIAYQDEANIYTTYTYNVDITTDFSSNGSYVCLSSIDEELNPNWTKYFGGDAYYFVCDMCPSIDGGSIITGTRYKNGSAGPFEREIFIMKVNEDGLVGTEEPEIPIKNAIITPNPGKDYLHLHTGIYPAQLQIFNINGQLVLEEVIQKNVTTIQTQSLSSGTYVWQLLKDGKVVETDKWVKE